MCNKETQVQSRLLGEQKKFPLYQMLLVITAGSGICRVALDNQPSQAPNFNTNQQ
jgi:hypothetical protein